MKLGPFLYFEIYLHHLFVNYISDILIKVKVLRLKHLSARPLAQHDFINNYAYVTLAHSLNTDKTKSSLATRHGLHPKKTQKRISIGEH